MAVKTILILSANPQGTSPLRLDKEVREIKAGLKRSQNRKLFKIEQAEAVTPRDVQRAMLEFGPQIVHFCGHGTGEPGIVLEGQGGQPQLVSGAALADLFDLFSDRVECVVLNACYAEHQARGIAQHIGSVIGMSQAIGEGAAIEYAVSFYDGLGAGREIAFAHRLGCNAIRLMGVGDGLTPVLFQANQGRLGFDYAQPTGEKTVGSEAERERVDYAQPTERAEEALAGEGFDSAQPTERAAVRAKVFISYKRDTVPDEGVAQQIYEALGSAHEVFIDRTMTVGTQWVARIDAEIERADVLIVLLSAVSVRSEMVMLELEKAHQLAQRRGRPLILPVRLAYAEPFQYPLSAYLNPINWAFWRDEGDTEGLIGELRRAIAGTPLSINSDKAKAAITERRQGTEHAATQPLQPPTPMAQPPSLKKLGLKKLGLEKLNLEKPEGTMTATSEFYVARAEDAVALESIAEEGVTLTIKGARQMGKSSLLIRVIEAAMQAGKRPVFLDFQMFDKATLGNADDFFYQFCLWLTDALALDSEDGLDSCWQRAQGNRQRCTRYVQRYVLPQIEQPLVLAMDEVESIFDTPFRTDFFGMLRSWHNQRATSALWRRLDLALVTSTEPYQLIDDLNQSPFNVGEVLDLPDFTLAQVQDLNRRHGGVLSGPQVQELMGLVNGHPYLVRRALYLVARGRLSAAELFAQATADRGPFGDHLRYHLFRIYDKPALVAALLQVIGGRGCANEQIFFRLRGAGLIRRGAAGAVPRCSLYASYFREHLRE